MKTLEEILDFTNRGTREIINDLKLKTLPVPSWEETSKAYYPKYHKIYSDTLGRKDKKRSDGVYEEAARLAIGLERLLAKRMTEFTFSLPVKRQYDNIDSEVRQAIARAMEAVYANAHINNENVKRGLAYYAACEICTVWYATKKPNTLYGVESQWKLKCKTYSPMDGYELYPLFDEYDDMVAMSLSYVKKVGQLDVEYFETFTADRRYKWKRNSQSEDGWESVINETKEDGEAVPGKEIKLMKIPAIYMWRNEPVFTEDMSRLRENIEYTLSRNSDTVAYNSAPVLKVSGEVEGQEEKGETQRIFNVENGGDVSYVSWDQSTDANKDHILNLLKFYWMQGQMPDVSFDNMLKLGSIGYDARQTLFTDAHLRVGDEAGSWYEFFEREANVVKAFLKLVEPAWEKEIDNVSVKHIITPFIQRDETSEIERRMKANGGKAIESQLESITKFGQSKDPQATLEQIQLEEKKSQEARANSLTSMFEDKSEDENDDDNDEE